jgi:hypothetical protein
MKMPGRQSGWTASIAAAQAELLEAWGRWLAWVEPQV